MWHFCGPGSWRTLFVTRKEIDDCATVQCASRIRDGGMGSTGCAGMLSSRHEVLPWPFRMNTCTMQHSSSLGCSRQTVNGLLVAQTANQLFNACQFYANRNASNEVGCLVAAATAVAVAGANCDFGSRAVARSCKTGIERSSWEAHPSLCRRGCSQAFSNRGHEERRIF